MVSLLEDNWESGNTNDVTPTIDEVFEHKRVDLRNNDFILLYEFAPHVTEPNSIGASRKKTLDSVSIDIRTMATRAHGIKLRDEVERIIDANIINPDSSYHLAVPLNVKDLSDKNVGMWRWVWNMNLINLNLARGS